MQRSTAYFASSWVLSLIAHVGAGVALFRTGGAPFTQHKSDAAQSREILLLPPPNTPPVVPPPQSKPEPKPEPAPEPKPEPPSEPAAVLGIDDGSDKSKNWIGANKETPHTGMKADQDQAQFTPQPGIPVVGSNSVPAKPVPVQAKPAPAQPPAPPPETPAIDPAPPEPQPAPPAPQAPRQVAPSPEQPDEKDARKTDKPEPGVKSPAPDHGPADPPKQPADLSNTIKPSPAGELPAPIPGAKPDVPDLSKESPRQLAAPPVAPKPAEQAAIDPTAVPNLEGDPKSKLERADKPAEARPDKPDQLVDDQPLPPDDASNDQPKDQPKPADLKKPAAPAPPPAPTPVLPDIEAKEDPSDLPPNPGAPGAAGAEVAGDRPGNQSDRETDASAVMPMVSSDRLGKPLAAKGLNIQTVRPRWATITTLTTSPKSPVVRIRFRRDGTVAEATFIEGFSTGYPDVDEPLLDAIHRWRAKGRQLEQLPPGEKRCLVLILKIQLH